MWLPEGGMHGCWGYVCMVARGGSMVAKGGGACVVKGVCMARGGMCSKGGACMAKGGVCGEGGMHGEGGMCVGYDEIRRHDQ